MSYFDQLVQRSEGNQLFDYHPNGHMQRCQCGQPLFFDNTKCLRCGSELGYDPMQGRLLNLEPAGGDHWTIVGDNRKVGQQFTRCVNLHSPAQCNWLVTDSATEPFCMACSLNMTIPDLSLSDNAEHWCKAEQAKRRLVAQLVMLGLPVVSRKLDPEQGLGFNLLRQLPGEDKVMTGHADGLITIDMDEADPAHRERVRQNMHEPYRTLLGHFRHESGHYYWDRLVRDTSWLKTVRDVFGDDRLDYQQALQVHYQNGPRPDWSTFFISSYASTHPWEDWAESWAHYLHMTDTLNVALDFGIQLDTLALHTDPFDSSQLNGVVPGHSDQVQFLSFINRWVQLSSVLNLLSRSMGQPDIYPFVLNEHSVRKLYVVHAVVADFGRAG